MSWFSRFRRRPTVEYVGRHRPGPCGEAALVAQAAVPAAPAPPVPSLPVEIAARQRVRLGFADGTSVDIDDETGVSEVFRLAAARLIDNPR